MQHTCDPPLRPVSARSKGIRAVLDLLPRAKHTRRDCGTMHNQPPRVSHTQYCRASLSIAWPCPAISDLRSLSAALPSGSSRVVGIPSSQSPRSRTTHPQRARYQRRRQHPRIRSEISPQTSSILDRSVAYPRSYHCVPYADLSLLRLLAFLPSCSPADDSSTTQ